MVGLPSIIKASRTSIILCNIFRSNLYKDARDFYIACLLIWLIFETTGVIKSSGLPTILIMNEIRIYFRSFFIILKTTKIDGESSKSGSKVLETREHDADQSLIELSNGVQLKVKTSIIYILSPGARYGSRWRGSRNGLYSQLKISPKRSA
jgi:hypothetical protein